MRIEPLPLLLAGSFRRASASLGSNCQAAIFTPKITPRYEEPRRRQDLGRRPDGEGGRSTVRRQTRPVRIIGRTAGFQQPFPYAHAGLTPQVAQIDEPTAHTRAVDGEERGCASSAEGDPDDPPLLSRVNQARLVSRSLKRRPTGTVGRATATGAVGVQRVGGQIDQQLDTAGR